MAVEIKVPTAGESIQEVMIVEWKVAEGAYVEADDPVVEIETDKASMEIPAPASGVLTGPLTAEGDTVNVGTVIGHVDPDAQPSGEAAKPSKQKQPQKSNKDDGADHKARDKQPAESAHAERSTATSPAPSGDGEQPAHVMPAAARLLAEHGLSAGDVQATGPGGRLLKEDVQRHLDEGAAAAAPSARPTDAPTPLRHEEAIPMSMLRRRVAERLVEAKRNTAMLTTFNEIDMSAVKALRSEHGPAFEAKYGIKLGFMSFFIKAAIDALKSTPALNAEIRGTDIVYKNYYDIGVAVGTEKGLVVPVIRNTERLSFAETEQAIVELAQRARDRKLTVEELQGGTFTISNGGVYGSLLSTPILNPPQSGILGLHTIQDRPIALDGAVVIRPMMYVALSYDHRIIDGKEAVTFLKRVKECIETPARMLLES